MKKKILFVEDNQFIKVLVDEVFTNDYEVVFAANGKEAIQILQSTSLPDLIISDLAMPEMTGMDLYQEISQSALLKDIPFIVVSASDSSQERIACLEQGINDYVIKPFNPRELFLRSRNIINKAA